MMRRSSLLLTATPASYSLYERGKNTLRKKRTGFGRQNKMRSKPGDNVAWYDKGPVEWIPRPIRVSPLQLDELRDWMMRETVDGKTDEFIRMKVMMRDYSQHPLRPMLGDGEPKFPKGVYKANHRISRRFVTRWHKANSPNHWMWMPRPSTNQDLPTPLHWPTASQYPENWKELMKMGKARQ